MDRPRRPLHTKDEFIYPDSTGREYIKVLAILILDLIFSFLVTIGRGWSIKYVWSDFVAVILIVSAAYKMFYLEDFVKIHRSYDVIAQRWPAWSYIFPFVETAIGADFLLSNGSTQLYIFTILVMGITFLARFSQPKSKSHLQYACLSNLVRLPVATLNLITSSLVLIITVGLLVTR